MEIVLSFILALVPAVIWAVFLFRDYRNKNLVAMIFFGGILAVFMIAVLQQLDLFISKHELRPFLSGFPVNESALDFLDQVWFVIQNYSPFAIVREKTVALLIVFVIAGALEEIVKQWLIRFVDNRYLLIRDINSSVKYSLVAALGFAFAENIYYFYAIWSYLGVEFLAAPVIFRSIFTTAAHMCFSGIWGYYYGKGKFCVNLVEEGKWQGRRMYFSRFTAWFTQMPVTQSFRELMILKGLAVAMIFHGIFNYLLEMGSVLPVIVSVIVAFAFLMFLLKRKAGNLVLVTDVDSRKLSRMAKPDEEAIIEYIGILYNKGLYDQVIETCERLLEKDSDNNVVKLFQAKAIDKKKVASYVRRLIRMKETAGKKSG